MPDRVFQMRAQLVLIFLFPLSGCMSVEAIQPESLEKDATHDIVVSTQDTRTIRLRGGDYQIIRDGESKLLQGKGELFLNEKRTETKSIEVEIPLSEITSVETRDKTIFHPTGPIILGTAALALILIIGFILGGGIGG